MDSLDSIWDDPVESKTKQPLFLQDSDENNVTKDKPSVPEMDVDIDAMFADIEDEDEFTFKPLGPFIDTEALRNEAEARHRSNLPPLTPHQILSSSPPRATGVEAVASGAGEEKDGRKPRRKLVTLDEGRLLGPDGFPKLIKDVKNFRIKGKGHEANDLDRLLRVYGYWTHALYPKTVFRDTVERIEKLCHSKRMNVALSVWRDEVHGKSSDQGDDDDGLANLPDAGADQRKHASCPTDDGVPSRPASQPPSSGTELDNNDDFNIDSIIREEEERIAKERAEPSRTSSNLPGHYDGSREQRRGKPILTDEDDEATMWEHFHEIEDSSIQQNTNASKNEGHSGNPVRRDADDDEDMWDVVREMEAGEGTRPPPQATSPIPADDDFESMYAD